MIVRPGMRPVLTRAAVSAAALLAFAALCPATAAEDDFKDTVVSVEKTGDKPNSNVEIVEDSYLRVAWKPRPGASAVIRTRDKVVSVTYGDEPSFWTRGLDAWRGGRWEEAEQEFRGAIAAFDAGRAREWVKKHSTFYIADCRRRQAIKANNPARYQEAADSYAEALKMDEKSPMLDRILLGRAECLAGAGKFDDALKTCDELMQVARGEQIPLWEAAARMMRGRVLEMRGETAAAATEFSDLSSFAASAAASAAPGSTEARDLERMKVRAMVRQGWSLFARAENTKSTADATAAKSFFERLATSAGSDVVGKAASANGLGAILLMEGKAGEALDLFLKVEVTMFAVPEEVARALWYKSKAYEALGNAEKRQEALADLKEFYPWSDWASRAR